MKRVTASEARKNWFRLLDEVARGEEVFLERHGKRIVLRAEDESKNNSPTVPDYRGLIQLVDSEDVVRWGWEWPGPEGELKPRLLDPPGDDS